MQKRKVKLNEVKYVIKQIINEESRYIFFLLKSLQFYIFTLRFERYIIGKFFYYSVYNYWSWIEALGDFEDDANADGYGDVFVLLKGWLGPLRVHLS